MPERYTPEQKADLVRKVFDGMIETSVEFACSEVGIAEASFYKWVALDQQLAEEYARARNIVSYRGESDLERINRLTLAGEYDPKAANVASQNVRWLMGRRNPKVYGDRSEVDVTSKGDKVQSNALDAQTVAEAMKLFKDSL
jgi:hypothetical protein